jgi:hypothetical protein
LFEIRMCVGGALQNAARPVHALFEPVGHREQVDFDSPHSHMEWPPVTFALTKFGVRNPPQAARFSDGGASLMNLHFATHL